MYVVVTFAFATGAVVVLGLGDAMVMIAFDLEFV